MQDSTAFKKTAVARKMRNMCGKSRVSMQSVSLLWAIVILHLEEIVRFSTDSAPEGKNVRIKESDVYAAIRSTQELCGLRDFVGIGSHLGNSSA